MIHACYACGHDIEGVPMQLSAVAKEGIEHYLCAECAHMIGHTRVYRFVTRCVSNAVKPYLNRTTEPAPAGMYDQKLVAAGIASDDDPWKHRSAGMLCSTCMWFVPKAPGAKLEPGETTFRKDVGRCRRHSPTMNGYPVVFVNDWCGDHKLDENKA